MDIAHAIVSLWTRQIRRARESKKDKFGKTAAEAWKYLNADYKNLYLVNDDPTVNDGQDFEGPAHKVRVNKSREFINLYLPFLHHKVPNRLVEPSRPQIPPELLNQVAGMPMPMTPLQRQDKTLAWLLEWILNYLPGLYDLRYEARKVIPEALVKGRGMIWHEMFNGPSGPLPGSFAGSVDDLVIDPDSRSLRNAGWIARKRRRSIWKVAEDYGYPREELRANYKSSFLTATEDNNPNVDEAYLAAIESGDDNGGGDVMEYWEVYSRIGLGQKFTSAGEEIKEVADAMEAVGPMVFLAIVPGMATPLNLPPHAAGSPTPEAEYQARLQWPIPFYENAAHPWPFSQLDFYPNIDGDPWATSPLEGALPLQRFIDNVYSYLAGRVRTTCRDLIVVSSALDVDIKAALLTGLDQEVITADGKVAEDIAKLIHVIQFPPVNADLWNVLSLAERAFENATGMGPLLAGGQTDTQMRSSAEAQIRQDNASSRPEDMAECVEQWMSEVAAKEAAALRMMVPGKVVSPLFGEQYQEDPLSGQVNMGMLTQWWTQFVNTPDPARAAAEFSYTVEAGSGRRRNKAKQAADANMLMQHLAQPTLQLFQAMGEPRPFNALVRAVADAFDIPNVDGFLLPMMQQQSAPPNQAPGQTPGQAPVQQGA